MAFAALLAVLLTLSSHGSFAAEFKFTKGVDGPGVCELSGEIQVGDDEKFREFTSSQNCVLSLNSPGGHYTTALSIIDAMDTHTPTIVRTGNQCLSACALIFMAGMDNEDGAYAQRRIEPGAVLGFHRPFLDLGDDVGKVYSSKEIERAFSGSVDVINNLIKRSNKRFWTSDSSAHSFYFPPVLLTSMLEKGRSEFYKLETVGDLIVAGVFYREFGDGDLASNSSEIETLRTVCENFYWQHIANFEPGLRRDGKLDIHTFYDESFREYVGGRVITEEKISGETYTVFHDYPAPEGTYRDCIVNRQGVRFSISFRDGSRMSELTSLRPIFGFPRHIPIEEIENLRRSRKERSELSPSTGTSFSTLENTDLSGVERRRMKGIELDVCVAECRDDAVCAAYTYDRWNRWCFLKSSVRTRLINPKSISGLRPGTATPSLSRRRVEMRSFLRKYFPSEGYATIRAANSEACERQCMTQEQCIAFTFYDVGTRCRMYSNVGEYFSHDGAVSGAKFQNE